MRSELGGLIPFFPPHYVLGLLKYVPYLTKKPDSSQLSIFSLSPLSKSDFLVVANKDFYYYIISIAYLYCRL